MPDTFKPNSPLARMEDAARRGDIKELQAGASALKGPLNQMEKASNDRDLAAALDAASALGLNVAQLFADIAPYISQTQAAISLLNLLIELGNKLLLEKDESVTAVFLGAELLAVLKVTAEIDKENKGWVIGDNEEKITNIRITVDRLQGIINNLNLIVDVTAYGIFQDGIEYKLVVNGVSDGSGPPLAISTSNLVDTAGLEAMQITGWLRQGCSKWVLDLGGQPGLVRYGLNGANVAVVMTVNGFLDGYRINPVQVASIGLSI